MHAGLVLSEFFEKTQALGHSDERAFVLMFNFLKTMQTVEPDQIRLCVYVNLLRAFAIAGVKPHLENCVRCKKVIDHDQAEIDFSTLAGGVVCKKDYDDSVISLRSKTVKNMALLFQQKKFVFNSETFDEFRILIPDYIYHHFGHLALHTLKYV
jgi:recombinational DNA repair protein (RecF pathway)